MNNLILEMRTVLTATVSEKIKFQFDLRNSLPNCIVDGSQLRQALTNLVMNTSEAIDGGNGTITISSGVNMSDDDEMASETSRPYFEVADTGCGMDKETQRRIFDPYFTTKFAGRGLGMAAVQGIVHTYSGEVAVESQLHKGSVVRISISLQQSTKIQEIDNQLQIPNEILRGSGTILVVDDEDIVLSVIISMLESLDFEVITIMDGEEGITKFETHVDRNFFAVILDRTMPKMDGKEVLQVIQKRSKPIPAIVCSGYSNSSFSQSFHEDEYANSIAKPFKLNVLNEHLSRFIN